MASEIGSQPLIRTKLYRPRVSEELVRRPRLLERLDQRRERPLTLISAPAGYGKTTLVSSWLEANDWPSAWLSLDEDDDEFGLFLAYLLAAIQTIFPDACADTLSLLQAISLPPLSILAQTLINELDQIEESFVLVLDDYHVVQNMDVHHLMSELLSRPPRPMHLVLASRVDPPLNLTRYRARRQVTEIRTHELRFTESETAAFLEKELGAPADERAVDDLLQQVEGWVTGMRLVTLSLRHRGAADLVPARTQESVSYITEYLMGEVVESQPPAIQVFLLHTAILDRLCAPLCQAVSSGFAGRRLVNKSQAPDAVTETAVAETVESEMDGERFLEWLTTANLFVIRLDDQGQWYRYHPLFRGILQDLLAERSSFDDIVALHKRASVWLAKNGLIDEALHHALAAGDTTGAAGLVAEQRHELMIQERWQLLERWQNLLPREAIEQNAELLLTEAWLLASKFRFEEIPPLLERVAVLLRGDETTLVDRDSAVLGGEIAALRSILLWWTGHGQLALENARHAVEVTPGEHEWVRGIGLTYHAAANQAVGQMDRAYEEIDKVLVEGGALTHRAYVTLLIVETLAGNLAGAEQAAQRLLDIAEPLRLMDSIAWARYALGFVHYQRNNLAEAKVNFAQVVKLRYQAHAASTAQGNYGLALTYQVLGEPDQALEASRASLAWASETGNAGMLLEAHSLASRLALLQGQVPDADRWAGLLGDAVPVMLLMHVPHLTLANVLLAQGTPGALQKAGDLLAQVGQLASSTHNTWRLMEITAMQAILMEAKGEHQTALDLLRQVVAWAEPRGFVRLFADLGPRMAELLDRLRRQGVAPEHIAEILVEFPAATTDHADAHLRRRTAKASRGPSPALIDALTNRELEVLELLTQGLSNKEIAALLVLAPGTVKQYTHRIYQKLNVKSRRQAVRTADAFGIHPTAAE